MVLFSFCQNVIFCSFVDITFKSKHMKILLVLQSVKHFDIYFILALLLQNIKLNQSNMNFYCQLLCWVLGGLQDKYVEIFIDDLLHVGLFKATSDFCKSSVSCYCKKNHMSRQVELVKVSFVTVTRQYSRTMHGSHAIFSGP